MVQIVPESPSFKTQIGRNLGAGLSQGLGQAAQFAQQMSMEKHKTDQRQKLLRDLQGQNLPVSSEQQQSMFIEALPEIEQTLGRELAPQEVDQLWNKFTQTSNKSQNDDYFSKAEQALAIEEPELARLYTERGKAKEKQSAQEKKLSFTETKDYRDLLSTKARSASELEPVLNQLETLIKSKKLTNPVIAKLAEKTGLIGILDPSSQQFHALSIGFLQDAKNIFGSRVTNYDLQTYIDKIPRLTQTNEGKKAIIDNFRTLGQAAKVKNKIKNEIIRVNKGVPPLDLEQQVEERSAPELDKLSEKFNRSFIESSKTSSGKVRMRNPEGQLGDVNEENIETALSKGYSLA